jgi:hypothetical protein
MTDPMNKLVAGWFDSAVLKGLAWACIPCLTVFLFLSDKYLDMRDKYAAVQLELARAVKSEDLTKFEAQFREDMRHAVKDAMAPIEARIISDELRMAALEVRIK